MWRSGPEPKPPWRTLPRSIRDRAGAELGSVIIRAARAWGSYSPSHTYRLTLADGRKAFFKGNAGTFNSFSRLALEREERVYRELGSIIRPWAPDFYRSFQEEPWHVLLIEDLGARSVLPWTTNIARSVTQAYAEFHKTTRDKPVPDWVQRSDELFARASWGQFDKTDRSTLLSLAGLAGDQARTAYAWIEEHIALFKELETSATTSQGETLLHCDTRSDNLRFHDGRLRLVDWPFARVGAPEVDVVGFAQSVAVEGGPSPDHVVAWYRERAELSDEILTCVAVGHAAFFGTMACQPELPGLPRLRSFQRRNFKMCR